MKDSPLKKSAMLRMVLIAGLTIVLLIPTVFIGFIAGDRQSTHTAAVAGIAATWGGEQYLTGPALTIPYLDRSKADRKNGPVTRHLNILPARLSIAGTVRPEIRYRGIYRAALYSARCSIDGAFPAVRPEDHGIAPGDMLWKEAYLTFGISDLRGIRDTIRILWDGVSLRPEPGMRCACIAESGITCRVPMEDGALPRAFSFALALNGSSALRFIPAGEITRVSLDAPWGDPGFDGAFLPVKREFGADRFHAEWQVLNLNRNFPQHWTGSAYKLRDAAFGVRFILPVEEYQKTERALKYAILFVALTFLAFFLSEVLARIVLHPVQYALIGLALVLFYILLLSLSEHMAFNTAYAVSAAAVILMVAAYARWITASRRIASFIFGVLALLYGFLFVTLQLEEYALLIGSIGLFVILLAVMLVTRNIDWYALGAAETPARDSQSPGDRRAP